jgi:dihydrofolate reductase
VISQAPVVDDAGDVGDVVLYAAVSLDGYLAGSDDGLGFLDDVAEAGQTYEGFYAGVDALLMGRRTYEIARSVPEWPYPGRRCVVVTSQRLTDLPDGVETDDGVDLPSLVARLRGHGRVWLVGGGVLARTLLAMGLVDELDLTVTPHLLGGGVPLFGPGTATHRLALVDATQPGAGTVRLRFRVPPL